MADVQANIVLTTTGGDQSASEIQKATTAISSMTSASSGMEAQFQHRFQHIGLMLFAGDALRASGLGRETRLVVSAMNAAITAGGEAAGLASGGMTLLITALIALAGIVVKVVEHHKDHTEAMEKAADAALKLADNTQKEVDKIEAYVDKGGTLTAMEQQELAAKKALAEVTLRQAEITMLEAIPAINAHIVKLGEEKANLVAHAATVNALADTWMFKYIPPFRIAAEIAKGFTGSSQELATKLSSIDVELKKQLATLAQYERTIVDIRAGNRLTWDEKLKELDAENQEADKVAKHEEEAYKKMWDKRIADARAFYKEHEKEIHKDEQIADKAAKFFSSSFGSAFAKVIVEGKSLSEEMSKAFQQMSEKIVEAIINIITEVVALIAAWSILDVVSGGAFGNPVTGVTVGQFVKKGVGFGGGFPVGGSAMVDSPTMFLAGEAGPELVNVSPLGATGAGGSAGAGPQINIGTILTTVSGVSNPDEIARRVGQRIVEEIRGRGQIDFVRG